MHSEPEEPVVAIQRSPWLQQSPFPQSTSVEEGQARLNSCAVSSWSLISRFLKPAAAFSRGISIAGKAALRVDFDALPWLVLGVGIVIEASFIFYQRSMSNFGEHTGTWEVVGRRHGSHCCAVVHDADESYSTTGNGCGGSGDAHSTFGARTSFSGR